MDIESLKDQYAGERIFLIGNGPSLDDTPLDRIEDEYSLAMNKITSIYERTSWRPTFYLFEHTDLAEIPEKQSHVRAHVDMDIPCFINSANREFLGDEDNVAYFDRISLLEESPFDWIDFHEADASTLVEQPTEKLDLFWSDDVTEIVYTYHSMYVAFQFISHMGFEDVYLLGCDMGSAFVAPHMVFQNALPPHEYVEYNDGKQRYIKDGIRQGTLFKSAINGILFRAITSKYKHKLGPVLKKFGLGGDDWHFGSAYRYRPGDMGRASREIYKSHRVANTLSNEKGMNIFNATLGGELEVYERVDLNEIL